MQAEIERLQVKVDALDAGIKEKLIEIRNGFNDDVAFGQWLKSPEYFKFLDDEGLDSIMSDVERIQLQLISKYANRYETNFLAAQEIITLSELNYDSILRRFSSEASYVRDVFYNSVVLGQDNETTLRQLQTTGLSKNQSGTVLQTTFYTLSRASTVLAFSDDPDQRFRYEDVIIPTSSEQCRWLVLNQKKEGYTMQEIMQGIKTPFKDKKGNALIINELGRVPNFNCIHTWEPILDED